jgi:hypothetical protein
MNQVLTTIEEPARGPAADEGVRPTIDVDGRNWENYVALGTIACPTKDFIGHENLAPAPLEQEEAG